MPGPVSDSYDPEFGTGQNAEDVRKAIEEVRAEVTHEIGSDKLKNIVALAQENPDPHQNIKPSYLTERELRIIRFCLDRAIETI